MGKRLIIIEINVVPRRDPALEISAVVYKIKNTRRAEEFQFIITQNKRPIYNETFVSSSLYLIKLKVIDELRNIIDAFDPADAAITIIEDSHALLSKTEFRCPNCHRKLFESWGKAKGMVVKCKRCSSIVRPGMPQV